MNFDGLFFIIYLININFRFVFPSLISNQAWSENFLFLRFSFDLFLFFSVQLWFKGGFVLLLRLLQFHLHHFYFWHFSDLSMSSHSTILNKLVFAPLAGRMKDVELKLSNFDLILLLLFFLFLVNHHCEWVYTTTEFPLSPWTCGNISIVLYVSHVVWAGSPDFVNLREWERACEVRMKVRRK